MRIYILLILLFINSIGFGQLDKLTFPVNGSVLQRNSSNQAVLRFGGVLRSIAPGAGHYSFRIAKLLGGGFQTPVSSGSITLGQSTPDGSQLFLLTVLVEEI